MVYNYVKPWTLVHTFILRQFQSQKHHNYIILIFYYFISEHQDYCVGTSKPLHYGFHEDSNLALKHVGILHVMYGL